MEFHVPSSYEETLIKLFNFNMCTLILSIFIPESLQICIVKLASKYRIFKSFCLVVWIRSTERFMIS